MQGRCATTQRQRVIPLDAFFMGVASVYTVPLADQIFLPDDPVFPVVHFNR